MIRVVISQIFIKELLYVLDLQTLFILLSIPAITSEEKICQL